MRRATTLVLATMLASCGGPSDTGSSGTGDDGTGDETTVEVVQGEVEREAPPESAPARDVQFPEIHRADVGGLDVNTVRFGHLPLVYLRLVIQSGDAQDPEELRGVAQMVAGMLKEGTRTRSSAELAEAVEFLGADLSTGSDEENVYVMIRALADQLDEAMAILADVARNPRFSETELRRLKQRELNRLRMSSQQPRYVGRR